MEGMDVQTHIFVLFCLLFFLLVLLEGLLINRRRRYRSRKKGRGHAGYENRGTGISEAAEHPQDIPGYYTEVHCHILPGVDDGAPDMQTALAMLREERMQGAGNVILTPHLRRRENDYRLIRKQYRRLQEKAQEEGLGIRLHLGNEIYYDSETIQNLRAGKAYTMAGSRYVLLEFSPSEHFSYISCAADEVMMAGYLPILAHAERYGCILKHLERVKALKEQGVYIQVNGDSFLKHPNRRELIMLAREGLVDLIGTDCHRMDWRPVCMSAVCRYLVHYLTREDYCRIFFENPQAVIENRVI